MKSILIINTGGTLGMCKSDQGYKPEANYLSERLKTQPEFQHPDMPTFTVKEYEPLLDSSDMTLEHWNSIAKDIAHHYEQYDGFLILHGTDTMAYTASALSFMLENLSKPIVITGSQVPLCEAHTDARENLINAILITSRYQIPEVCIFFNNQLFRGNRCQKVNANSFNAFGSPNFPPLAKVGIHIEIEAKNLLKSTHKSLHLQLIQPCSIAHMRLYPGFSMKLLEQIILISPKAVILDTYGIGNAPLNQAFQDSLQRAMEQDILIINHSQCFKAKVDMQSYATGHALLKLGVLSGLDMTSEAIYCKLLYLFSKYSSTQTIKEQFAHNLIGELTE